MKNFYKQPIFWLCVAVFAVSLAYSFYFRVTPAVDARAYDSIGWNVAQGFGYRESLAGEIEKDNSIIRVGPGYEFFLAAIFYIFGHHYYPVWILQALFLALAAWLAFLTAKEVFGEKFKPVMGLVAAALIGFSPDLITISSMLMTENLGIFMAMLSTYLFFVYTRRVSIGFAVLFAITASTAVMVRTPLLFLLIPEIGYLVLRRRIKHAAIVFLIAAAPFVPWIIRNYSVYGVFLPTNAASGFNLLVGNHHGATGEQEPYQPLAEYVEKLGYIEANNTATREAVGFIIHNPFEFLKITLYRASIYFSFARPTGFWFHLHGLSKILTLITSAIYSVLLFTFGFWGISQVRKFSGDERRRAMLLLAMLVMMPLALIGIIVETRYRFLCYPFFAVFAGYGFSELLNRRLELKTAVIIFGILFANTAFDVLRNAARIIERIGGL